MEWRGKGETFVKELKLGDFFGEETILKEETATSVRAITYCDLLVLEDKDLAEVSEDFRSLAAAIAKTLEYRENERASMYKHERRRLKKRRSSRSNDQQAAIAAATAAADAAAVGKRRSRTVSGIGRGTNATAAAVAAAAAAVAANTKEDIRKGAALADADAVASAKESMRKEKQSSYSDGTSGGLSGTKSPYTVMLNENRVGCVAETPSEPEPGSVSGSTLMTEIRACQRDLKTFRDHVDTRLSKIEEMLGSLLDTKKIAPATTTSQEAACVKK
eukprot:g4893.t1